MNVTVVVSGQVTARCRLSKSPKIDVMFKLWSSVAVGVNFLLRTLVRTSVLSRAGSSLELLCFCGIDCGHTNMAAQRKVKV